MMNRSAHSAIIGALKDEDLHGIIVIDRRPLNLQHQDLPDVVLGRHRPLVRHVLLELQIHEELGVGLAVHEVLGDDVVRLVAEAFVGDCLNF